MLGETKARKWERAGAKLAKLLASRGWSVEPVGEKKAIDVHAERNKRELFIDVKAGRSYLIRSSQLKKLLEYRSKTNDVGFACEMDGKFYLLTLKEVL